jgi:hypothetical protein
MKTLLSILGLFVAISASAQNNGEFHVDKDYTMSSTGTLRLNTSDAKVQITGSTRKNAHVKIDRSVESKGMVFGRQDFSVDISENNGDLDIRERSNTVSVGVVGYYHEEYRIKLEIPEGASLIVKGDDGDYLVTNVDGAIAMTIDDADVELTRCSGDKFEFRVDDGDIKMDEGRGRLQIDGDDSDVEILNGAFTSIEANVDDGDLVIETSLADNGDYFIDGQDGLISLTITKGGGSFDIRHDDARVSTVGNFEKVEDSEDRTRLVLASGNAKVGIRADDARVRIARK